MLLLSLNISPENYVGCHSSGKKITSKIDCRLQLADHCTLYSVPKIRSFSSPSSSINTAKSLVANSAKKTTVV